MKETWSLSLKDSVLQNDNSKLFNIFSYDFLIINEF